MWVTYQEARCLHGSPVHLWLAVPWRDMTWQAKADSEGLKRRLWDLEKALEQAREDKRDIHEGEGRDGRGQWDRGRDPTLWCCWGKPAVLIPPLPSALIAQPQSILLLVSPALSHAVSKGSGHGLTAPQIPAQAEETTEADFPACKSHCLAISVSAQEGADFSSGKTSARGLRSPPYAKLRAHFHSPTLDREVKLSLQGSLLPPAPGIVTALPGRERAHTRLLLMRHPARGALRPGLAGASAWSQLLGSKHRGCLFVSPIVTTSVPFSLPWLPEMTRQYQELQKQTAAHSQRLEAKVKSLQEQLGMVPQHDCPLPVGGDWVCSRAEKCI